MRLKVIALLVMTLMCLFSAEAQTLIESESSIIINEKTADIEFVVENSNASFDTKITLELLDKDNKLLATTSENVKLKKGKKTYKFTLSLKKLLQADEEEIIWYRLRYRIGGRSEIISLSELVRDNFEIRVIATDNLIAGMTYRNRIRAFDPLNNKAVKDVKINAELEIELKGDKESKLKANAKTNADGFAFLEFKIPVEANLEDAELTVNGRKNGLLREANEDLSVVRDDFNFLMLTDKPIYQPEQEINIRGILLKGGQGQVVVADMEIEFKIEDEENTLLYRETTKTSEFGVASISWKIPENAKLGKYSIRVKTTDDDDLGYHSVKVSRYDLPNFVVKPKPDKTYYLSDEKEAEVEVRADYLFGKPVTKGKVRIVQENSREWNYKEQKYEIDEGAVREGEIDSDGKFTAKFDLSEAHEDLSDSSYSKFRDINFVAYFTDLTTNKTEQRRFDVRVTKEPIHVYFIGDRYDLNPNLPVTAYISTFYADGIPAICDVEIIGRDDDSNDKFKTIQRVQTNSYGAGKIEFMRPKFEDDDDNLDFRINAVDEKGKKGTFGYNDRYDDKINFDDDDDTIKVKTEKTIYKPGEKIKIEVTSNLQSGLVYVDVVKGWSVIDSYFVNLKKGKAVLKIPYKDDFQGDLKIAAYIEDEDDEDELIHASHGIIFPAPQTLQVHAKFDKETYKPAEEATINFSVLNTLGNVVESALGVVVFDKAVEERARTDSDFGGMSRGFFGWLGYGSSFGGVNVKDLNELDLSKPISDELQLVAEVMLYDSYYRPNIFHSRNYDTDAKSVYSEYFRKQFEPLEKALKETYEKKNFRHPTDEDSLKQILAENNLNLEAMRDPWEQKYQAVIEVAKTQDVIKINSSGADKKFGTDDDFTVSSSSFTYFTPMGNEIDKAVKKYHERTGEFIRDEKTLLKELGISELKDRFNRPYRLFFEVSGRFFLMRIHSLGIDGVYEQYSWRGDDFDVWTNRIDYFATNESKIGVALQNLEEKPLNEKDFIKVLSDKGIEFEQIKDGYGESIYVTKQQFSRFTDKVEVENVIKYGEKETVQRTKITPVTQEVLQFTLRSKGGNRRLGDYDDLTLAQFLFVVSEQTKDDEKPVIKDEKIVYTNGTGAIRGTISDAAGAIIPAASVTATNESSTQSRTVTANDEGEYLITNLAVGSYKVTASADNFQTTVQSGIPVIANKTTEANISMQVAGASVTVDVSGGVLTVDTTSSSISTTVDASQVTALPKGTNFSSLLALQPGVVGQREQLEVVVIDGKNFVQDEYGKLIPFAEKSTPRLREYFPETLLWNPEVITDKNGKAELKFKMADNITTWKLYTIASTKNGKIGVAEKEVQAFQPFFVDLEPPKFLTQGDEIYLPTQVRNYTKQKQKVDVTMSRSDWFSFLNAETRTPINVANDQIKKVEVLSGESENAVFGFRADKFIKGGKQKVTAIAETDSDAIEKPVTVRPNGQEIVKTESKLFRQKTEFNVDFPANALANTPKAELKIYPNLFAHVAESVEGLLQRPYGCSEQTISSTYPNLMILKFTPKDHKMRPVAQKFLAKGYERLVGYQVASGGFSYWGGKDEADISLTAYALRFLNDAKPFIAVDQESIKRAENWLISQQKTNGSWTRKYSWENTEDTRRTKIMTSYVAKTLASIKSENKDALQRSLTYLKTRNEEIDEPYALALFGLASIDAGNLEDAKMVAERLSEMAITENNGVYWKLETNTPFYGWGTAGRIETTALVVQFLTRVQRPESDVQSPKFEDLVAKGTHFLLKNKDRYGVWYSTQTTINVLDAFLATLDGQKNDSSVKRTAEVFINGQVATSIELPPINELASLINIDLSSLLTANSNRVEIKTNDNSTIMTQVVQEHYIDWQDTTITNSDTNQSRQIRLNYKCDKLNAEIMQEINCEVKAERVGFRGYGMLLAEIGIPPGADVSRESLENALDTDWSFSRYDILPDRIIVYMWAKAGGTNFKFKFKPRYGINAQTPASFVYDYYNEEAKATIAPMRFDVK